MQRCAAHSCRAARISSNALRPIWVECAKETVARTTGPRCALGISGQGNGGKRPRAARLSYWKKLETEFAEPCRNLLERGLDVVS